MRKIHITRLATVAGVTGAIAVAAIAFAADQKPAPQPAAAAVASNITVKFVTASPALMAKYGTDSTSSQAGMRAYVDADTKQLRAATQADLDASAAAQAPAAAPAAARRSATFAAAAAVAGPVTVQLENGTTKATLDESFLSYAVATIGADGKVKAECVEQQPNAPAALRAAAAKPGVDRHEK